MSTSTIDIKNLSGATILSAITTEDAISHEELMTSDYIQLSWNSNTGDTLPAGAYIMHGTEKYSLLEPYTPTRADEAEYQYTPQFQSRIMGWQKHPVPIYTYADDGITVETREFDWEFTGSPADAMYMVQQAIKNETGETWTAQLSDSLPATISISSQSGSIFSVLNDIANQCETEWWGDKATNTLYLSQCKHGTAIPLSVGGNVKAPSVTSSKDGYFTRFYVFGSSRNVTQDTPQGAATNSIINRRLTLDPATYPGGYIDAKPNMQQGEIFTTTLYYDDIYPSSKLAISDVRSRLKYRLDSSGNKIQTGADDEGNPVYEQYAIWYFQIADFSFDPETIIEGMNLSVSFETGQLAGRDFELAYHDKTETVNDGADVVPFNILAGDFEIILDESTGTIIPGLAYIIPQEGDQVILYNIEMPAEYTASARQELAETAQKDIAKRMADNNSYEFDSNPVDFYENDTDLTLGQAVTFSNGEMSLSTRVLMVEKHTDSPCRQRIRVGNEIIKGNTQQLREEVTQASQNIDILAAFNELSTSLQNTYGKYQREMAAWVARINGMWRFDPNDPTAIYSDYGVYSNSFISAKGKEDESGGTPTGATKLSELIDVSLSSPSDGQALVYDLATQKWVNKAIETGGIDEEELAAYLTENNYAKKSDIPSLDGYATEAWVTGKNYATVSDLDSRIDALVNGAPAAFDTLKEIADVLQDNVDSIGDILTALGNKVDKVAGKGLSSNDFTDALLAKLNGIEEGANKYVLPTATGSVLGGVKVGTTLAIASGVLNMKAVGTAGTYTKVTVDTYGRVTGHASLAATDIPPLDWSKITSGKPTTLAGYGITDGVNDVSVTGNGNVVSAASISGHTLTLTKGVTAVTTSRTVTAGYGLTGGGALSANITLNIVSANAGITVNADNIQLNTINALTSTDTVKPLSAAQGKVIWDFITDLFEKVNIGTSSAPVWAIRAKYGLYTESFLSAKGANPDSGGTVVGVTALSELTDVSITPETLSNNDMLRWNGSKWVAVAMADITPDLSGYATQAWVTSQKYLTTVSIATITDLHSSWDSVLKAQKPAWLTTVSLATISDLHASWDALLKAAPSAYVTRWPTAAEVGALTQTAADGRYLLKSSYTAADVLAKLKTVDGSGSGIDADLLDGYHASSYLRNFNVGNVDFNTLTTSGVYRLGHTVSDGASNGPTSAEWSQMLVMHGGGDTIAQMAIGYNTHKMYIRSGNPSDVGGDGTWSDWYTIARTVDNVASATQLKTARTLWGQSFNGTANVSGNMTGVGSITMSGNIDGYTSITSAYGDGNRRMRFNTGNIEFLCPTGGWATGLVISTNDGASGLGYVAGAFGTGDSIDRYYFYGGTYTSPKMVIQTGGNVGIGTTSPSYKLHVVGTGYFSGALSTASSFTAASYIYTNAGWFQNNISGAGLFNKAVDARWYANGSGWISDKKINATAGLAVTGAATFSGTITASGLITANGGLTTSQYIQVGSGRIKWDSTNNALYVEKSDGTAIGFYSKGWVSAKGANDDSGTGGGGSSYSRLDSWDDYDSSKSGWVLSALLGNDLNTRVESLEAGSALSLTTTGSGNVVTAVSKSGTTLAVTKGITAALSTGTNATGTWPISIQVKDIRNTSPTPNDKADRAVDFWFNNTGKPGSGPWYSGMTVKGWTDGYAVWQIASDSSTALSDSNLYFRSGVGTSWNAWKKVLDSTNYTTYTVTKTGGGASGTWNINVLGYAQYSHSGTVDCHRTFTKNDNHGYDTFLLIADCSSLYTDSSNHGHYGFVGDVIVSRTAGYVIANTGFVSARIGHSTESLGIYSTTRNVKPCIVKYNSKYYIAFRLYGSSFNAYLRGLFYNTLSTFTQLNCPSSSALPDGLSIVTNSQICQLDARVYFADQLTTARTINGTAFNGTANITTAKWGTARNIYIRDASQAHTGTAVSVDGSANEYLLLPSTITATLSGNASTASKWATARTITLTGAVTGSVSIDGSGNVSMATTYATGNISALDSRYVNISGDTMTGALKWNTNGVTSSIYSKNSSWFHYETDAPSGHWFNSRVNVQGEIYAGANYNQKVWHAGNDGSGSGLDADLLDGTHKTGLLTSVTSSSTTNLSVAVGGTTKSVADLYATYLDGVTLAGLRSLGYAMQKTTIDASSLDEDTWYPVTINLAAAHSVLIALIVSLDSNTKPSWSTHASGFSVRKVWYSNGNGWGINAVNRVVLFSDYSFTDTDPVRGLNQMHNSSNEYIYVRGGGRYYFYISHGKVPVLRTSTYTEKEQSVSPTTTAPAVISRTNAYVTDNVASATKLQTARTIWGQSFNGTANVSGNMTGVGSIAMNGTLVNNGGAIEIYGKTPFIDFHYNSSTADYTSRLIAISSNILQCTSNFVVDDNVGIGTNSPSYKLHVVGTSYFSGAATFGSSITAASYIYTNAGWFQNNISGAGLFNKAVDARWYANGSGWISDKKINATAGLAVTGAATFSSTITASGDISTTAGLIKITKNGNTTTIGSQNATWCHIYNSSSAGFIFNKKVCTTGGGSLGDTQYRWEGVYSTTGNFSGAVTAASTLTVTGAITGNSTIYAKTGMYSDGYVSAKGQNSSSDIRLKNILSNVRLKISDIAKAPLFRFAWKSNPGMVEIGSSAQYWKNVLPDTVKERDGWLEMSYGNIALAGVITIAREVETLEQRVDRLEKENGKLKKKIKELERRAA